MEIESIGSYFVGGHIETLSGLAEFQAVYAAGGNPVTINPNGDYMTGQMYVPYVRLREPRFPYPLSMWHGGGLTGSTWETTPDGREGWQSYFLKAGYDVYLPDAVERGRSSWSMYPQIYKGSPTFRTFRHVWRSFRIGPAYEGPSRKEAYEGTQFPCDCFEQFMKAAVPRWNCNDQAILAAYQEFLEGLGPNILIAHSQGGGYALKAAARETSRVKALVLLEPSGVPELTQTEWEVLSAVPQLILWGDHIGQYAMWAAYYKKVRTYYEVMEKKNPLAQWVELPDLEIRGNSHVLYLDRNSDQIAGFVDQWIRGALHAGEGQDEN